MPTTSPPTTGPARTASPRLLVGLAVASCATVYAAGFVSGQSASLASIAAGVVFFAVYALLRRHVQQAADLPDEDLDEREISVRDRSYLVAYRYLGGAVALSLLLGIVDDALGGDLVRSWLGPLAAVCLLSAVLPSAVLALTQTADPDGVA